MKEKPHDYQIPAVKVDTKVIDGEWLENLKASSWWQHDNIQTPELYFKEKANISEKDREMLASRWAEFLKLHGLLLSIGGYETCFPCVEKDMANILARGRYYGDEREAFSVSRKCLQPLDGQQG